MTLRPHEVDFKKRNQMFEDRLKATKRLAAIEEDFKRMGAFLGALVSVALLIPTFSTWPVYGAIPMLLIVALVVRYAFMFVVRLTWIRKALQRLDREHPMPEKIDFS